MALLKVHDRLVEAEENTQGLMTRMLVCHTQAGCIIGKYASLTSSPMQPPGTPPPPHGGASSAGILPSFSPSL